MIFEKFLKSISIFILSFVTFTALPYYPFEFAAIISVALLLTTLLLTQLSVILYSIFFFIALAYHSLTLAIIYVILFIGLLAVFFSREEQFIKLFLFLSMIPVLARLNIGAEFLIVFLAASTYQKENAFLVSFLACLSGIVVGLINHKVTLGNLILVQPTIRYYAHKAPPETFYNLTWFPSVVAIQMIKRGTLYIIPRNIVRTLFLHLHLIVQPILWGLSSFLFSNYFDYRERINIVKSIGYSLGILVLGHGAINMFSLPMIKVSLSYLVISILISTGLFFAGFTVYQLEKRRVAGKLSLPTPEPEEFQTEEEKDPYILEEEYRDTPPPEGSEEQ